MNKLKHLILPVSDISSENFSSRGRGGEPKIPSRDKSIHANNLKGQIEGIKKNSNVDSVFSIKFKGQKGAPLLFENLDLSSLGLELLSVKETNGIVQANVKLNKKTSLDGILKKIKEYNDSEKENPLPYIASIELIEKTELKDFFTDDLSLFPEDNSKIWWEVYILNKSQNRQSIINEFRSKIANTSIEISKNELVFEDRIVFKCKSTKLELDNLRNVCLDIAEIRIAKTIETHILDLPSEESGLLRDKLFENIVYPKSDKTRVVILDGNNIRRHPLITQALIKNQVAHSVLNPDNKEAHATEMASLSLFGNIIDLKNNLPYNLNHKVEGVQIFDNDGGVSQELWGHITEEALNITSDNENNIYVMPVTETSGDKHNGRPSTWSGYIDYLCCSRKKNFAISVGNFLGIHKKNVYSNLQHKSCIESPAQSWNCLSVGAYTELCDANVSDFTPFAQPQDLSPHSRTSCSFGKQWPIKPEVLFEGGNKIIDSDGTVMSSEYFDLISCAPDFNNRDFVNINATSASTALAGKFMAELMHNYPEFWPETIRGLVVHSADWTPIMFSYLEGNSSNKSKVIELSKRFGYGVPNITKARYSASNSLTLIAEKEIQVYGQRKNKNGVVERYKRGAKKGEIKHDKLSQICFFDLPWPKEILENELAHQNVKIRITLSYFIEPNPSERGYSNKYAYQSHNFRFDLKKPEETLDNFKRRINKYIEEENNQDNQSTDKFEGLPWQYGSRSTMRTKGSIHKDILETTGAQLASMGTIAVYSVEGWWKDKSHIPADRTNSRFSLIIDIEAPETTVDLYSEIKNIIEIPLPIKI